MARNEGRGTVLDIVIFLKFNAEVTLGERALRMPPPSPNKAAQYDCETQRRRHQKSKTGVSVIPLKGDVSTKIFSKKLEVNCQKGLKS